MRFNSHYDAPVRLAALLVNTLTSGERRGRPYVAPQADAQRQTATEVLLSVSPDIDRLPAAEAAQLATFAVALRVVFASAAVEDLDAAAHQVNRLLHKTRAQPSMARHDEDLWHLHFSGTAGGVALEWAGACATALGIVLGSDARNRLGLCNAPHCDRVYVDTSHNGTRRFCSTACQNRVKAAAFRNRTRA